MILSFSLIKRTTCSLICNFMFLEAIGQWGSWGDCSSSCGPGSESRTRVCFAVGPSACSGISLSENRNCVEIVSMKLF